MTTYTLHNTHTGERRPIEATCPLDAWRQAAQADVLTGQSHRIEPTPAPTSEPYEVAP